LSVRSLSDGLVVGLVALTVSAGFRAAAHDFRPVAGAPAVEVLVDTSGAPDLAAWAEVARRLIVEWHPRIADMLKTEGFTPATEVKLVFDKDMKGVAHTSGHTITISASHVRKNPRDYGVVVHELVHVLQRYPRSDKDTGWLVEGIADYVRYYRFEPKTPLPRIDPTRASYRNGYKTSARFLAWIERKHDKAIITKLNQALRNGDYRPETFEEWTGKNLDQLWEEFVRAMPRR
jgi:hypothetical protein